MQPDRYEHDIFLIWPTVVMHKIDKSSPLYDISAADLINENYGSKELESLFKKRFIE